MSRPSCPNQGGSSEIAFLVLMGYICRCNGPDIEGTGSASPPSPHHPFPSLTRSACPQYGPAHPHPAAVPGRAMPGGGGKSAFPSAFEWPAKKTKHPPRSAYSTSPPSSFPIRHWICICRRLRRRACRWVSSWWAARCGRHVSALCLTLGTIWWTHPRPPARTHARTHARAIRLESQHAHLVLISSVCPPNRRVSWPPADRRRLFLCVADSQQNLPVWDPSGHPTDNLRRDRRDLNRSPTQGHGSSRDEMKSDLVSFLAEQKEPSRHRNHRVRFRFKICVSLSFSAPLSLPTPILPHTHPST